MKLACGIDENGLGPRLGPLIVTAVWADVDADAPRSALRPSDLASAVGDSKRLVAHTNVSLGEAWARELGDRGATSPNALLDRLLLIPASDLKKPCPREHVAQCWSSEGESFAASSGDIERARTTRARLADRGIRLLGARTAVVCTSELTRAAEDGLTRLDVDLHCMESLIESVREHAGRDVEFTCGKVGGLAYYGPRLARLAGYPRTILEESARASTYRFAGLGEVTFLRDAEDQNLLVGLASLAGKWVRELLMARIVRYHRLHDPTLSAVSGYGDSKTTRFIEATRLARRERSLPERCFVRLGPESRATSERRQPASKREMDD